MNKSYLVITLMEDIYERFGYFMKRRLISYVAVLMLIVLSGCGSGLPQMTYEQEEMIVEYAASAVVQHMDDYRSRLVDLSLYDTIETIPEETEPAGMDPVTDTKTVDVSNQVKQMTVGEVLSLSDVDMYFENYELSDSYPGEDAGDLYFTLDAQNGKKLLVLHFILQNLSQEAKEVNILSTEPRFLVTINDEKRINTLSTILLDDITTFVGQLPASAQEEMVMIVELDDQTAASINNMKLTISSRMGQCTIPLE